MSQANAEQVRLATGLDVANYRRVMDSGDIRHSLKEHGNREREGLRRPPQRAITSSDFAKVKAIVSQGRVVKVKKSARGAPTITYEATLRGMRYTLVEQVRKSAGQVALKTLFKRKV